MSENQKFRHSFLDPEKTDPNLIRINRFGHTILTNGSNLEKNVLPHESMEVGIDKEGNIVANKKNDIVDHPAIQALVSKINVLENANTTPIEIHQPENQIKGSIFDNLPSNLEELDRETQLIDDYVQPIEEVSEPVIKIEKINQVECNQCKIHNPLNAKFCAHCGVSLARFCCNCGYKFNGPEKFCPDCGNKR